MIGLFKVFILASSASIAVIALVFDIDLVATAALTFFLFHLTVTLLEKLFESKRR